jgi:hypothetical protein
MSFGKSKRERGRQRARNFRRARERADDRLAYINRQLNTDESLLVQPTGIWPRQFLTGKRILLVWPRQSSLRDWTHDSVWYDELTSWRWGQEHDGRPFVVLVHPPHIRLEWVPAHRFLWFRWGNAEGAVEHTHTRITFRSKRDPAIAVVRDRLDRKV